MHICLGSSCFSRGNKEVVMYIRDYLKKNHLEDRFVFRGARCMGNCSKGPNLKIDESIFEGLSLSQIDAILEEVLAGTKQ
ncbi:MAG: NAD(P)H-dependent oxidoreductase subunit E [Bacteroidales bacterium]|nr:NAD(P)H-dependent oxidoreductase subunit E [Bacteroidales bacterium]